MKTITSILTEHPTDKELGHGYGPMYDRVLCQFRETSYPILEIGVFGGGSMRAWKEAFPLAMIHGVDINPQLMITGEDRIRTHCLDVLDRKALLEVASKNGPFCIVVDDGSHALADMLIAYGVLKDFMTCGGVYVIEDIQNERDLQALIAVTGGTPEDRRHVRPYHDDLALVIQF